MSLQPSWTYTRNFGAGAVPSLVVPAGDLGIGHAITNIASSVKVTGAVAFAPTLTIVCAGVTYYTRTLLTNAPAGAVDQDSFDEAVNIQTIPGFPFTIAWSGALPAGSVGSFKVDGYDH